MIRAARRHEAGFSLIEVIVALGLLASVLLSISGIFVVGERQVLRGRNRSTALAAAQSIAEEIGAWNHEAAWESFGLSGNAPAYTVDTKVNSFAAKWQPALEAALAGGHAEILIESCDGADVAMTGAVRVVVRILWDEFTTPRQLELALVRL